ncbi:hypothetical protein N0V84_004697 [Fusarium piperis]|uniref:DUF7025 domain-containing protein n=1 Tax=Fusarium piperis TaxID=1435070 RepID=A0A9W9BPM0_9HYPO|nr:hypothetical protein N0V84_004697 [Fusarium piperis]
MPSSATAEAYSKILDEQDTPQKDEVAQKTEDRKPHSVGFEDISEIWDPLVDDSSDSDNEVIKTRHLRSRPRHKRADKKFGDISLLLRRKFAQHVEGLREKGRRLEVQSTQLQAELRHLLQDVSGDMNWDEDPIKICQPYQVLFHGRERIAAIVNHNGNDEKTQELHLVHDFIHREEGLKTTLKRYSQCVPHGQISFDLLWTIYMPTKILVSTFEGTLECYRCIRVSDLITTPTGEESYHITLESINFNGSQVGKTMCTTTLTGFKGVRNISSLPLTPLDGHPQEVDIRALMTSRHAQFQALIKAGYSHKHYQGLAWVPVKDNSRRRDSNNSESDQLLCPARIPGFSLRHRRWGWFLIDEAYLTDIEWKADPFQYLVMEESRKKVIEHLVKGHMNGGGYDFDDLVAGKGRGLIILLRGAPGLGKTLMAEKTLQRVFELGKRWQAILLLDEADALMCPRKTGAIEMNSIVAGMPRPALGPLSSD